MKYENYHIHASTSLLKFEFHSEGPRGKIRKQVLFKMFPENPGVFNLGFGDVEPDGSVNDTVVTDNKDGQKVLATVALTVYKFFEQYPSSFVYVTGSTEARTRLYRIGITNNYDEIGIDFELFGYIESRWEPFKKGRSYEAFLVRRKK